MFLRRSHVLATDRSRYDHILFPCLAALILVSEKNHPGLIAMTTLAAPGTTGGELCFPEYALKVPVKPGDLLIAATSREWHCNLSAVKGLKFSVVCYKRKLDSLKMLRTYKLKVAESKIQQLRESKKPQLPS